MELKDCTLGKIVRQTNTEDKLKIGHIIGLAYNSMKEIIIEIKLPVPVTSAEGSSTITLTHPANLEEVS